LCFCFFQMGDLLAYLISIQHRNLKLLLPPFRK
jgi:hypothetical protein